jgi:hypothetical protein
MKNLNLLVLFGIFQFIISCSEKVEPINDEEASEIARDIDGNEYDVVLVNGRKWLLQDLRTSKYRDGTAIPRVEDPAEWSQLNEGAYTWYDNVPQMMKHMVKYIMAMQSLAVKFVQKGGDCRLIMKFRVSEILCLKGKHYQIWWSNGGFLNGLQIMALMVGRDL